MIQTLLLTALVAMAATPAVGQVEFTFEGYAMMDPGINQVGAEMTVYGIANPAVSAPTPLPMDFDTYQYTVCVTGMTVTDYQFDGVNAVKLFDFTGGTLRIYSDMIAGGTAGDYAAPASFVDGEMLLEASVDDGWHMRLDDPAGFGYTGSGAGTCDLSGGTALPTLQGLDYPLVDWTFAGTAISAPSFFVTVPDGYDYVFGVKVVFPYDPTADESLSFGQVKNLFR